MKKKRCVAFFTSNNIKNPLSYDFIYLPEECSAAKDEICGLRLSREDENDKTVRPDRSICVRPGQTAHHRSVNDVSERKTCEPIVSVDRNKSKSIFVKLTTTVFKVKT